MNDSQHPKYNGKDQTHKVDFALLKLWDSAKISKTSDVVCLPMDRNNLYTGEELMVSGWGGIIYDGINSPVLRAAYVKGIHLFFVILHCSN